MDRLNQTCMSDRCLQYNYRGDPSVPMGVLGMVDDTLSVSECDTDTIKRMPS